MKVSPKFYETQQSGYDDADQEAMFSMKEKLGDFILPRSTLTAAIQKINKNPASNNGTIVGTADSFNQLLTSQQDSSSSLVNSKNPNRNSQQFTQNRQLQKQQLKIVPQSLRDDSIDYERQVNTDPYE